MKKTKQRTSLETLNFCDEQEDLTKKRIDHILDTCEWTDKDAKKCLKIASEILKLTEELKQLALDEIIK